MVFTTDDTEVNLKPHKFGVVEVSKEIFKMLKFALTFQSS